MKRRVMIARAMVHAPKLLILDEPTAGVDIEIRRSMWEMMKDVNAQGTTIILTTHYLEEAESLCRNIAIIDSGKIIENSDMASLLTRLHVDYFILDLAKPVKKIILNGYEVKQISEKVLEIGVPKERNLNDLFAQLSAENIEVISMKNKSNRLEQLFINLIDNKNAREA
ncbi:MAG: ABC transporter ATP-binding protein, partial [Methylococcaceae bacterium]